MYDKVGPAYPRKLKRESKRHLFFFFKSLTSVPETPTPVLQEVLHCVSSYVAVKARDNKL